MQPVQQFKLPARLDRTFALLHDLGLTLLFELLECHFGLLRRERDLVHFLEKRRSVCAALVKVASLRR